LDAFKNQREALVNWKILPSNWQVFSKLSAHRFKKKRFVMMAADNGVYEEGFNSYPQEITQAVAELAGRVNRDFRYAGETLWSKAVVVDVGTLKMK
jgi:NaMN:DMB phosphoribosyltransferase